MASTPRPSQLLWKLLIRKQTSIHGFVYAPGTYDFQQQHRRRRKSCSSNVERHEETTILRPKFTTKDESVVVDVSDVASSMRCQVRNYTATLKAKVRLVGILAEGRTDAETYSEMIQTTFTEDGLDYSVYRCPGDRPEEVEAAIYEMNHSRPDVHGILVFYPMFQQRTAGYGGGDTYFNPATGVHYRKASPPYYLNPGNGVYYKTVDDYLRDCVVPAKDVEGACHDYKDLWHRQLFQARGGKNRFPNDVYIPCTVTAVLKILETFHLTKERELPLDEGSTIASWASIGQTIRPQRWKGCTATVVNRSTILGRPLAALLALGGATVYSVDEKSIIQFQSGGRMRRCGKDLTLNDCLRQSSVVVTAVPRKNFHLDCNAIADYTTVVDVSEHSNVDHEMLLRKRGIQLVPTVGKVTVAALEHNLIRLHRQQLRVAE